MKAESFGCKAGGCLLQFCGCQRQHPDPNAELVDDDRPTHARMNVAIVRVSPRSWKRPVDRGVGVVPVDVRWRAVAGVEEDVVRH